MKNPKLKILAGTLFLFSFFIHMGCFGEDSHEDLLTIAVSQDKIKDVRSLLADGAVVEGSGIVPQTPLMIAAFRGNIAIARLLLASGADPNRITQHGESALY
uniref:Ankyrin repeat-containing protein n=1 Tax=Candidatus Kentrum sp. LFY TaxID=2126342 RepID=A0A450V708_9GAMM|nr:MAG: Ankyrin repeat-containing protein [Candidatus Kentron sp. LFY]